MRRIAFFMAAFLCFQATMFAADDAAELEAQGITALKNSQANPDAIIAATICFAKAAASYDKAGNETKTTELNSYLYWCRKKMTLQQIDAYLKGDATVATRLKELEKIAPPPDDAQKYFDRAESYAKKHASEHLLIAIRFYEVADRFKGSTPGMKALDRSLTEMTLAGQVPIADAKAPAARNEPKSKVPSPPEQKEAEKLIREVYAADFTAKGTAEKLALSKKLCTQADENTNDLAGRYVLLAQAARLSAEAADLDAMFFALDKLAATFEGDFDNLRRADLALMISTTHDQKLSKLAMAFKTLLDKPNEPSAALVVGKYRCFEKGEGDLGLPLLAKSSHPALSKMAKDDVANPVLPTEQIAVGDAWWDYAEKTADTEEKKFCQERAGYWYLKALPTLSGLNRIKFEKRIESAGLKGSTSKTSPVASNSHVDLMKLIAPERQTVRGKWELIDGKLVSDGSLHGLLQIPYHPPEEYDFNVEFSLARHAWVVLPITSSKGQFEYQIGWHGKAGFELVDGQRSNSNPSSAPFSLEADTHYRVRIEVRDSGVSAFIDGKLISELKTEVHRLRPQEDWVLPDSKALAVTNDSVRTTYYSISVDLPVMFDPIGKWRKQDGGILAFLDDHRLTFLDAGGSWHVDGEKLILDFDKWGHKEIVISDPDKFTEGPNTFTRMADKSKSIQKPPDKIPAEHGKPAANAPDPACPLCKGLGIVPNLPYKPYVRIDSQPPEANVPPAWKYCEKCQKGMDVKVLTAEMKERQERARASHKDIVEKSGIKLELILTPYVAIHSNMPLAAARKAADNLEKCTALLQTNSKSMTLTATRPDIDDVYIFKDSQSLDSFIDTICPEAAAGKGRVNFSLPHRDVEMKSTPDDGLTVFAFAKLLLESATDRKARNWLVEGFTAYCERKIAGTNVHFHRTKDLTGNPANWNERMRKIVTDGKQKTWEDLFELNYGEMSLNDSICCCSVVTCLIELDASRFDKFILNIKDGEESTTAIENAYGRKLDELQKYWLQWVQKQK